MALNPKQLLQLGERWKIFNEQHPRVLDFIRDVGRNSIEPGTILELKVTENSGRTAVTNIRLTEDDVETIAILKGLKGN